MIGVIISFGHDSNRWTEATASWQDVKQRLKKRKKFSWLKLLYRLVPITDWLGHYEWKKNIMADIVAGITVAIMNVPQGMAYADLADVGEKYGLYTSVFPVMMYCIFGPSLHVSMGTNPLTAILIQSAISDSSYMNQFHNKTSSQIPEGTLVYDGPVFESEEDVKLQCMIALSLLVGMWQFLFGILHLGKLSWILSEVLVSGYTTGAAVHVFMSQLKGIFGFNISAEPPVRGFLKIPYILKAFFENITETNWASVIIAVIAIAVLTFNNEYLKPRVKKYTKFPIPMQLIVVIIGTLLSYFCKFEDEFGVRVVGNITTGIEKPMVPDTSLFKEFIASSIIIAIVGYSVTLSMGKIFATKFNYSLDGNQELFAEGAANVFGSFFRCFPSAASMSRSMVQVSVGGKTQLTSIVSLGILLLVIGFIAQVFQALPKAILSAIIVVALKGMLWQIFDLKTFYRRSKLDGLLWIGSFAAVLLTDVDYGLYIGIGLSILLLVYREYNVKISEMGTVEDTGLFMPIKDSERAQRQNNAVIYQIAGAINFSNFETTLDAIRRKLKHVPDTVQTVILDFSCVPYVDQTSAKAIKSWLDSKTVSKVKRRLIAAPNVCVESMLLEFDVDSSLMFPSLLDALLFHPDPPVTILNGSNGAANGGYVNGSYVNGSGITKLESTATLISEASSKL